MVQVQKAPLAVGRHRRVFPNFEILVCFGVFSKLGNLQINPNDNDFFFTHFRNGTPLLGLLNHHTDHLNTHAVIAIRFAMTRGESATCT